MNFAVILSGGVGTRMKSHVPKQYILVEEKPILIHTLEAFEKAHIIDHIIIVASKVWQETISSWCAEYHIQKKIGYAIPGATRQGSILNGLNECIKISSNDDDTVIIHDAVRPMVSVELIETCITKAKMYGGCMPVLHVNDTMYLSKDGKRVDSLLNRDQLYAGQSPEAFRLVAYLRMNLDRPKEELESYRGTSEIAYRYGKEYGIELCLTPGEEQNYKITTHEDLQRYKIIMGEKK